ncbi:MAG: extracellular solute-binding protein, partial [Lachnospiraceae bacterium]|nr:extracellular solute-binding protein [Lachnospiraceae bacterium]
TIALALAGAMTLSLVACGNSDSGSENTNTADTSSTDTNTTDTSSSDASNSSDTSTDVADTSSAAGIDGYTAFADNVTLRVPVYDRGVEGVPTVDDNYWTGWIQENFGDKYNVTVEFVPITRTDVMTDYALLAAAGDLPTILMEYDYPKLSSWANDGYLTTFNMDDFAQVAPNYYNRMVENGQLTYTTLNGETYFALAYRPYYNCGYTFQTFVRMDWLREVGYDHVPATREEYVDAMTKIQEAGICAHPKGGAQVPDRGADQNYSYRTYPQDEQHWVMYGDVTIPALGSDENRALLKRENEDYNLGFTNPEYYITDDETNKAAFINGDAYQYANYISSSMDFLTAFYEQNPDGELAILPVGVEDAAGGTVPAWRADNPFGMIIGFSANASEDEIKAAWMYMEWMTQEDVLFTMQWGIEGENYTMGADGLPVSVSDYSGDYTQGFNNSKDYWCVTIEARNAGTIEDQVKANTPQDLPQNFTQDIVDFYNGRVALSSKGYAVNDAIFGVVLESETEYVASLGSLYKEYRDQLTMCSPDEFDALYDDLAQKYLDAGYQEVLDERLEVYNAGNSTKLPQ